MLPEEQCDQMARLIYNICPFAIMKISPIASVLCQRSGFKSLANVKTPQKLPKSFKILPKWCNFTKSPGHTVEEYSRLAQRLKLFVYRNVSMSMIATKIV